ncbi:MAG: 16S rRNA (cytidine(1402)-2'-O)-methyltransferase [Paracoccaceae bacterium]
MNEFIYPEIKPGLYIISLPVGCLSDISFRALHMLGNSDYVAGEDTRNVKSLFRLLKISKSTRDIISYHDHSSSNIRKKIIELIKEGKSVALVSDAGTPLISDPGYKLVRNAIEEDLEVFSVPGPSSVIAALTVSGLPTDTFSFLGFLPHTKAKKKKLLETYLKLESSLIIFESGKRLQKTLDLLAETCRPSTEICICRELTKLNEEITRFMAEEGTKVIKKMRSLKGEFVIIVGKSEAGDFDLKNLDEQLKKLKKSMSMKGSVDLLAEQLKIPKNTIYKKALTIFKDKN